jgi:hypothetical protein
MSSSAWSDSLKEQTREAIAEMRAFPDGKLHFKHKTLGYGVVSFEALASNVLLLRTEKDNSEQLFHDVESLLNAGWAID